MLKRPSVHSACNACLRRILCLTRRAQRTAAGTGEPLPDVVNTRVFFASVLIASFQTQVFEVVGPLETRLTAAAVAVHADDELIRFVHSALSNKTVVFTGVRSAQLEQMIRDVDGRITTSVSKKTDVLVANERRGKYETAMRINREAGYTKINIIEWRTLQDLGLDLDRA